jgi:hypothetical protein
LFGLFADYLTDFGILEESLPKFSLFGGTIGDQ